MIPGGSKDLNPLCPAAPNHRLRYSANAHPGMVNCELCGGEAPLGYLIDDGSDTPSTPQGFNAEAQSIFSGAKRATIWQLTKAVMALGMVVRDYGNALKTGTYTGSGAGGTKTLADLRSDFATKYQAL